MDTNALFRVDGMVAVVTGGGTGIGLNMALGLASAGARKVYILGRRKSVLEEAAKAHPSVHPVECDVGSKASLLAAVDAVAKDSGGHVNLLVANSGVLGPTARWDNPNSGTTLSEQRKRFLEGVDMDEFTHTFHVNVTAAYFTMIAFLDLLDAGNKSALSGDPDVFGAPIANSKNAQAKAVPAIQSQVIFTSSISAYSRTSASAPAYSGSKAAIAHLMKHASTNLAPYGIRVNALAPGLFPSELAQSLIATRDPSTEAPSDPLFIPARRFGGEEEMAGTVLYLASRAGSFCNGLVLVNDGGKLSTIPSEY
ncbi:short chain dehydrogenase [Xylariaceae sp. FL0594]|nr:short chain dehydrogenase [Xylariaceae sp. FL0594]